MIAFFDGLVRCPKCNKVITYAEINKELSKIVGESKDVETYLRKK